MPQDKNDQDKGDAMGKIFLLTNDDGIKSDGLFRLAKTASEFGEVWVVAPDDQRSAASHSITLRNSIEVHPCDIGIENVHAFSCSGMPADCIRVGLLNVMNKKPDVIMSGINFGYNLATDIQYSATLGAAFEGEFQGYLSIAFSEGMNECHEVTDHYLKDIMAELIEKEYMEGQVWNVNFPQCRLSECKGVLKDRRVSRKSFYNDRYKVLETFHDGGLNLMVDGIYTPEHEEGTDYGAILDNYVSVGVVKNIS